MGYPFEIEKTETTETVADNCRLCNSEFTIHYDNKAVLATILKPCRCGKCEG